SARLPDAALHFFGTNPEMRVARVGIAPGVEDRDDRLRGDVFGGETRLLRPRAMAEGSQIVAPEPLVAPQVLRLSPGSGHVVHRISPLQHGLPDGLRIARRNP